MSYSNSIKKALESVTTSRYTPPRLRGDKDYHGHDDEYDDFPYVEDPTPYVTHKMMEMRKVMKNLMEQPKKEGPTDPDSSSLVKGGSPVNPPEAGDPALEDDPSLAGLGMGAAGGGVQDKDYVKLDSSEIGRVYEMKKIYSRLTSVESYLAESTNQHLLELRRGVGKAIDLFEVVITNISKFKERIDPIIVTFYEFLDQVYSALRKYHVVQAKAATQSKTR